MSHARGERRDTRCSGRGRSATAELGEGGGEALTLRCSSDGRPCELLAASSTEPPCSFCGRWLASTAAELTGLRLGRIEREILLAASPARGVHSPMPTTAARSSVRRAATKLERAGLVHLHPIRVCRPARRVASRIRNPEGGSFLTFTVDQRARVWELGARRTLLGEGAVAIYGGELAGGGRIRWERLIEEAPGLGETPAELRSRQAPSGPRPPGLCEAWTEFSRLRTGAEE